MTERTDLDRAEAMRLDVFLSRSRLIMPRQSAKRACDNEIVWINGRLAKPSTDVRIGDQITVRFSDQDLTVEVTKFPRKSVPKAQAKDHYDIVNDQRYTT